MRALEHLAHAGDGAAGADAGHQDVHLAVRVAPDLFGGGPAVDLRVGGVLELLGHEVLRVGGGQLFRLADGAAHAFGAGGQDQFGAVGTQQHAPLLCSSFGHDQDAGVAAGGGDHGQGDAGVAAGRLDDDRVRVESSPAFSAASIMEKPMRSLTL